MRIRLEFGGHLASHYTRKHSKVVPATYNLFELQIAYIEFRSVRAIKPIGIDARELQRLRITVLHGFTEGKMTQEN